MALHIGTSGYSYKEWVGSFYPEGLPAKQMLAYYAARFSSVEINNTFYRMPNAATLQGWAAEVPPEFVFVLKATQRLTHQKRLKDCPDDTAYFLRIAEELGPRLGPLFFQLPPNMKKDVARLDAYLDTVPAKYRTAWEFRHETWFADDVYAVLAKHGAALCIADAEDLSTPVVATAPWGYLRLRRQDYDPAALGAWAKTIREQGTWKDTFVFFKHEEAGRGPRLGADLQKLLA